MTYKSWVSRTPCRVSHRTGLHPDPPPFAEVLTAEGPAGGGLPGATRAVCIPNVSDGHADAAIGFPPLRPRPATRSETLLPFGWGHDVEDARLSAAKAHAGVNTNVLTDNQAYDEASGTAVLFGTPVAVEPLA